MTTRQVTALYRGAEEARRAVDALVEAGFPGEDVSVLLLDRGRVEEAEVDQRTAIPATLPIGAAAGALAGTAVAVSGVLPGIGLLAAGPVLGLLQGLVAGTAAGSLLGTLLGLGWWKTEAEIPEDALHAGGVLVGIAVPEGRRHEAASALRRAGPEDVRVS